MTHFMVGVIVPREVYERGNREIEFYIAQVMEPYAEDREVEPYIVKSASEIKEEYLRRGPREEDIRAWAEDYYDYGYYLDEEGNLVCTFNREALYDWYRIGGRFDGIIRDNYQCSDNGFNFSEKHETIENNSIAIKELLKKVNRNALVIQGEECPYILTHLIDLEGKVHREGEMGYFGDMTREKSRRDWIEEYLSLLEKNKEHYLVVLDCHI